MALPAELWPSDTKAFFGENYSSSTGIWSDDMAIASDLTQTTSGSRPSEDTSTAPSGRKILNFNTTQWLNTGGAVPSGSLAAWTGSGKWVEFFILKLNALQDSDFYRFIDFNNDYHLHFFGKLWRWAAMSNANLDLTVVRVIFVADAATGVGTLYLNGTAQSTTAFGLTTVLRTEWTNNKSIAATSAGSEASDCKIGCLGFIQRSTFGSTEIAALDAAMDEWWTTVPSGSPQTVTTSSVVSAEAFGRANVFGGNPGPRKLFRQFPHLVHRNASRLYSIPSPARTLFEREFFGGGITLSGLISAEAFGTASVSLGGGVGGQTVSPGGIASAQALGTGSQVNMKLLMQAIASLEAFGALKINRNVLPSSVVSAEALGTARIGLYLRPTALSSAETFGTLAVQRGGVTVSPSGIATAYASGTAKINFTLYPVAISTAVAFGSTTVTSLAHISPSGITTAQAFGTAKVNLAVSPSSITSAETFGTTSVLRGGVTVTASGIATGQAFGTAIISAGGTVLAPSGIASGQTFGTTTVVRGAVTVSPSGINSAQAFGTAKLNLNVLPSGIATANAFGTTSVLRGMVTISPSGIATGLAFGTHSVSVGSSTVSPSGIPTGEAFGTPQLNFRVSLTGIASAYASGTSKVSLNVAGAGAIQTAYATGTAQINRNILGTGIASAAAVPSPVVAPGIITINPNGIPTAQAIGSHVISSGATLILDAGNITSAAVVSSPTLLPGAVTVQPSSITSDAVVSVPRLASVLRPTGIAGAEAFGTLKLSRNIATAGIASAEAFGSLIVSSGAVFIAPVSITTGQAFGVLTVSVGVHTIHTSGLSSAEAFGSASVLRGTVQLSPSSIASTQALGVPALSKISHIAATGLLSQESFGAPKLNLLLSGVGGIVSGAFVPSPSVLKFIQDISVSGIPSAEAIGRPFVFLNVLPAVVVKAVPGPTGIARANSKVLVRGPSIHASPTRSPSQGGGDQKDKEPTMPIITGRPFPGPKGTKR